jgi:hypothetical protein
VQHPLFVLDHRDPSPAGRYDHNPILNERSYGSSLDYLVRIGRCHDAPVTVSLSILNQRPSLGPFVFNPVSGDRLPYRFGGTIECRIVAIDDDLRDDGRNHDGRPKRVEGVLKTLLDHVSHPTLGVGYAYLEREQGQSTVFLPQLAPKQMIADLRAVPVRDDQPAGAPESETHETLCRQGCPAEVGSDGVVAGILYGVAAEPYNHEWGRAGAPRYIHMVTLG